MPKAVLSAPLNPESIYVDENGKEHKAIEHPEGRISGFDVSEEALRSDPMLISVNDYKEAQKAAGKQAKEAANQSDPSSTDSDPADPGGSRGG